MLDYRKEGKIRDVYELKEKANICRQKISEVYQLYHANFRTTLLKEYGDESKKIGDYYHDFLDYLKVSSNSFFRDLFYDQYQRALIKAGEDDNLDIEIEAHPGNIKLSAWDTFYIINHIYKDPWKSRKKLEEQNRYDDVVNLINIVSESSITDICEYVSKNYLARINILKNIE